MQLSGCSCVGMRVCVCGVGQAGLSVSSAHTSRAGHPACARVPQVGGFKMGGGGQSKGPPPAVKKVLSLFGSGREEDKMVGYLSFLKVGPKLLKFLPGAWGGQRWGARAGVGGLCRERWRVGGTCLQGGMHGRRRRAARTASSMHTRACARSPRPLLAGAQARRYGTCALG